MTDWLVIESVPKDGTHVDLLNGEEVVRGVYWGEPEDEDDDDPDEGWLRDGDYALEEGSVPTHWRALLPKLELAQEQVGPWRALNPGGYFIIARDKPAPRLPSSFPAWRPLLSTDRSPSRE